MLVDSQQTGLKSKMIEVCLDCWTKEKPQKIGVRVDKTKRFVGYRRAQLESGATIAAKQQAEQERRAVETAYNNAKLLSNNTIDDDLAFENGVKTLVEWVERARFCARCLRPFVYATLNPYSLRTQHHCRLCGNAVCFECASLMLPVGRQRTLRCCRRCFGIVRQLENSLQTDVNRKKMVFECNTVYVSYIQSFYC
jgi:NADH pyrophosphatase NudC (nudix superfamily)